MASKLGVVATFVLLLLAAGVAEARHYPLASVLGDKEAALLAKQDIADTAQLLKRAATATARRKLAKATGLKLARINGWAKMCDLLRIRGVGPQMVKLLNMAEVTTVRQFRSQRPIPLAKRVKRANKKTKVTETPPNSEQLRNWINQAKKLQLVLQ